MHRFNEQIQTPNVGDWQKNDSLDRKEGPNDYPTKKGQKVERINTKGRPIFTEEGNSNEAIVTIGGLNTQHALMEEDYKEKMKLLIIQSDEISSGRFNVHGKKLLFAKRSLFLFTETNMIRKVAVWIMEWNMYDYTDQNALTTYNQALNSIGDAFTFLFTFEAAIKIFSMGFIVHKKSYLRDGWNFVDFFIVVTGVIDYVATSINLKSLRTLRVLRPLKSINAIPSMRRLVTTLLQSLPELGNAAIFLSFMIILFGILGLQQFSGVMYYKCRLTPAPLNSTYWPKSPDYTRTCSLSSDGAFQCPSNLYCGSPLDAGISLNDDGVYDDPTIQFGISSFDNFGQAVLGVFQTISKDGWSQLMYVMQDGSNSIFSRIYFCCIIVFGSFFLLNLILAVIMANFTRISQIDEENDLIEKEKKYKQDKKLDFSMLTTEDILNMDSSEEEDVFQEIQNAQVKFDNDLKSQQTIKHADTLEKNNNIHPVEFEQLDGSLNDEEFKDTTPQNKASYQDVLPLNEKDIRTPISQKKQSNMLQVTPKTISPFTDGKQQNGQNKSNPKNVDFTTTFGIVQKQKTAQSNGENNYHRASTSIKRFQEIEQEMEQSEYLEDYNDKLEKQQKLFEEQKQILEKMDLDIKKRYAQSKRRIYGIDNEQEIVSEIKKGIKAQILIQDEEKRIMDQEPEDSTPKKMLRLRQNEEVEKELDDVTLMALKICSNLKQINLKQHLQAVILQKFRSQLIQKNMLEKMFAKVEGQMTQNILSMRANKLSLFGVCLKITSSKFFSALIIFCILANAVVLSLDRYPQDNQENQMLNYFNLAFFSVFGLELVLKLTGLGVVYYFKDKFNWFDSLVVFVSIIDIILQYSKIGQNLSGGAISAMRVFRVIRIFQLAKVWKNFQNLLIVISNTVKDISNVSVLIFLFIFTYTLLGMDLFAYQVKFNDNNALSFSSDAHYPQSTFNSFIRSFTSVFIVLANDGWTTIYFDHYRAVGSVPASMYFISLMILGQYILLNLFIAILIENFEQVSVHQATVNKLNEENKQMKTSEKIARFFFKIIRKQYVERDDSELAQLMRKKKDESDQKQPSLFLFRINNGIRIRCQKLTTHKQFDNVMLFIILISSVQLAIDNPLNDTNSVLSGILKILDIVLTIIFAIEASLKVIAFGFIRCGSTSYIRNEWNVLDFIVVMISIISQVISSKNINSIKILRLLKVLRPLRVISRNQGLKISLRSLGKAIPGIINVSIISLVFYLIFGIIGVNYLKGMYFYCDYSYIKAPSAFFRRLNTKWDCLDYGGHWINYFQNFDNIFQAMSTLFTISTAVDWSDVMYRGAASRGIDLVPQDMNNSNYIIFFLAFMIVGNFFLLNLFVGVVISTYNREKEVLGRNFLLTEKQRKWLENKIMMVQSKPMLKMKLPANEWRQPFFMLAEFIWFERFIYFCIIANTMILAIQWQNQPTLWNSITEKINYAFAAIFTFEVVVKFIAYGKRYFKDGWNNFDIIIVLMTLISIILSATTSYQLGAQTTIIRSFRIGRIFKLFRRNKSLKSIFQTFLVTLPAMANVGSLLILFIFIYAILGMYMFADIKLNGELTEDANFQNVSNAFLLLVRISTGESWSKLMYALQQGYDEQYQCIYNAVYDDYKANGCNFYFNQIISVDTTIGCGSYVFPIIYFFSYILLVQLIYLKLFIAIILQGFQDTTERDNKLLDSEANDKFREVWSNYDPDSYGMFLGKLGEPLGWEEDFTYNYLKQLNYLDEVSLPKYNAGKDFQFMDVFESLALLMIVKKEVKKYLIKYTRKVQMIKDKKKEIEKRKKDHAFNKKHYNQKNLSKPSPLAIKQQPKITTQSSIRDKKQGDLKIKQRTQNLDNVTDNSGQNQKGRTKQGARLEANIDELLYMETDQHNEDLKNQLQQLLKGQLPSDTQATANFQGNSRMNSNQQNFQVLNTIPRQSVGYNGEIRSDLNEDDIEAQINALLQNNSLLNDLELNLNQDTKQPAQPNNINNNNHTQQQFYESQMKMGNNQPQGDIRSRNQTPMRNVQSSSTTVHKYGFQK